MTSSTGVVLERFKYEPYGKRIGGIPKDGPGYTGHVLDVETGLNYMQQRYYDPGIGRFLSVDPVTANSGTGANFNRYWYANNNPYKFTDPDGRAAIVTRMENGSLNIDVPINFTGPAATTTNIDKVKSDIASAWSGTFQIDGKPTKISVQVVAVDANTPKKAINNSVIVGKTYM